MPDLLRLYLKDECEQWAPGMDRGPRPLDWERCRTCGGTGKRGSMATAPVFDAFLGEHVWKPVPPLACVACGGHGSLRAAALAHFSRQFGPGWGRCGVGGYGSRVAGCGHPMSDGTWERMSPWSPAGDRYIEPALGQLREGVEPDGREVAAVHWSPCDEGCTHGGPMVRSAYEVAKGWDVWPEEIPAPIRELVDRNHVEAAWRQVGVRTLGWAFDLRPENLAVLCLRCWAART